MNPLRFFLRIGGPGALVVALLCLGTSPAQAQDDVRITEFMAVNDSTLADPNGAFPDWIELYNAGSNTVNLGGWYLTDNATKLTKWRFPSIDLAGFGYMVVFASGTSQTNPALPLSTSFSLNGGGEYLALVKTDGVTIVSEFAPTFPPQFSDVSYGTSMLFTTNTLLATGANGRFLVPSADMGSNWLQMAYDDSAWLAGPTGVGYDTSTNYPALIATDIRAAMQSVNSSVFIRMPFYVSDPSVLRELRLRMRYDDGFAAYLNGQPVAASNAPAALAWNSAATIAHGLPVLTYPTIQNFDTVGTAYTLNSFSGGYTPTIMPADSGSSGRFIRLASLAGNELNTIAFNRSATGTFARVIATFDFRLTPPSGGMPADGMGFALLPTATYGATNGLATGFGEEPNLPGAIGVGFDIYNNASSPPEPNDNHVSLHYNGVEVSGTAAIPSFRLTNGKFNRAVITIRFDSGNAFVTVSLTPDIYGTAGPTETLFKDFKIPTVAPYEARAAFGARTGGAYANHDLDNVSVQFGPSSTLDAEEFDITSALPYLKPGTNLLAIQGLNITASDADFVIVPELVARTISLSTNPPGYFAVPTPGAPNVSGVPQFTAPPRILTPGGIFTNSGFYVSIALDVAPAEIRYTVNGSEPSASSLLYTGPILVTNRSTTVRAAAFASGRLPSITVSETYTLLDPDLLAFSSNLPLVIIDTFGGGIPAEVKVPATMTFIDTFRGRSSLRRAPDLQVRAGIEVRGQSSAGFPKRPFGFETRDETDESKNVGFFGLPAENDWVLNGPYDDKTFMNDFLAFELHEKMGHYSSRRRFVEVFVNSSGGKLSYAQHYGGIYVLDEKIKVGKNRVNIAKLSPDDATEPALSGGYMVKKDKTSPGDVLFTTTSGQTLIFHDPKPPDLTPLQQGWIVNYLNQFERALYSPSWLSAGGTNHYSNYIDLDSFVDQHWIIEFTKNIDGYRLSNYMHKDRGGKLAMDPIWDFDLSFGNANYLAADQTNGWYYAELGDGDHIWLRQMVGLPSGSPAGDPDFKQRITDRWGVLRTNILNGSNVLARVDEIAALLNEAQVRDFQAFPRLGVYVWPNPDSYWPITTYQGTIDWMKSWIAGRFAWIESQYPLLAPELSHGSGQVPIGFYASIASTNPVYLTLDGTDPRLPGGALSPSALLYTTVFPITTNVRVFARARTPAGAWSPPAVASLFTRPPPLVITEIMYHPPSAPEGSPYADEDFEYIELKNIGTNALQLRNTQLSGGIDFTFSNLVLAAGQRVLVVKNKAAFQSRYGTNPIVAGQFSGTLDNNGDQLVLTGSLGEPILDFRYDDTWYPITDGAGFSLVIADENGPVASWGQKSGWRPSAALNGSPGAREPAPLSFPAVLINEALAHSAPPDLDQIELFNASELDANIGGWVLSDDFHTKKFRIPDHTIIPAGGFLVFSESDFNTPGNGIPFALDSAGDELYVFSADANTNLTGYVHGFSFGAQRSGVTFGRYITSDGEEQFAAQSASTLGGANAYPLVGPVVISEIMYRPPEVFTNGGFYDNTEDEYIELHNISGAPVPLYDPSYPTHTWKFDQAVHYTFPAGVVIPADGRVLVANFDPTNDTTQLAAFRSKYSLAPATPIFGPYDGKLNNSDESLELKIPDQPGTNGEVHYVLLDQVHYRPEAPWPAAANGAGFSLQRIREGDYGNDVINWAAAAPTPGASNYFGVPPIILIEPQDQTVAALTRVAFNVSASGGEALFYQWRFNGEILHGATNASLVLSNAQPAASGDYQVLVRNASSAVESQTAHLTVLVPFRLVTQPQSRSVRLSSLTNVLGTNVTFFISTFGGSALTYQWKFNGTDIPGATNISYTLTTVSLTNEGNFQVLVSDGANPVLSDPARLSVLVAPVIVQALQPTTTALQGEDVSWTVAVAGYPLPFNFQWRRSSLPLTNLMLTTTTSTFTLHNVQLTNAALYRVVITNVASAGAGVPANTSSTLTVLADSDGDHIWDDWELQYGFKLNDPTVATGDPDHDGMTTLQEYVAGTNPTNALSVLKLDQIRSGATGSLTFAAVSNKTYSVQFNDGLGNANWLKLSDLEARPTNWTAVIPDPATNRSRYYRIVTPRQ